MSRARNLPVGKAARNSRARALRSLGIIFVGNNTDSSCPLSTALVQRFVQLHVPDRRPERDALITATALVHRLKLVTRNVADFEPMGVDLIAPWE
jgi:predicted nucleic acid-binding protein